LLSPVKSNEEIATIFDEWNQTDLASYLLEITCVILRAKENRVSVLDTILDKAGNKGTGSWSTQSALDLGTVNTMMSSAVFARYISSFKTMRVVLSKEIERKESLAFISIKNLEQAYRFARIINHHQGFELIRTASETYRWNVNLSEIARIWTNGCIIRSQFIETSVELFKEYQQYVEKEEIRAFLQSSEAVVSESIQYAIQHRIPLDTFWSAYNYWIAITTENLPVNLIQAQRDYFGAHTYQKKGFAEDQFFHTNWTSL
jgi:6-phosphogluconate dehydrogenase